MVILSVGGVSFPFSKTLVTGYRYTPDPLPHTKLISPVWLWPNHRYTLLTLLGHLSSPITCRCSKSWKDLWLSRMDHGYELLMDTTCHFCWLSFLGEISQRWVRPMRVFRYALSPLVLSAATSMLISILFFWLFNARTGGVIVLPNMYIVTQIWTTYSDKLNCLILQAVYNIGVLKKMNGQHKFVVCVSLIRYCLCRSIGNSEKMEGINLNE